MMRTYIPNKHSTNNIRGGVKMEFIKKNQYVLLAFSLCVVFAIVFIQKQKQEIVYEQIVVAPGDTLWAYSQQYAEDVPSDKWINEIMTINNLVSPTIQVGDELRIPVSGNVRQMDQIATKTMEDEE